MPIPRTQAKKLLTAAEMKLFEASGARDVKELTGTQLAAKVKRARALRDKYRDLLKRQTRKSSRSGAGGSATGRRMANERTRQKAKLLDEVLERFRKQAEAQKRRKAKVRNAPARKATGRKTPARKQGKARTRKVRVVSTRELVQRKREALARQQAARSVELSPKAPAHGPPGAGAAEGDTDQVLRDPQRFGDSRTSAIHGHVSSLDRVNQAKRDKRG